MTKPPPIPAFVISLAGSPRRELATKNLAEVGITNPIFFDAVNGKNLTPEQLKPFEESKRRYWFHRNIHKGAMGATHSHIGVWQKIVDENIPYALIFEDDVKLIHDDPALVADCLNTLVSIQESLDIVRLVRRKRRGLIRVDNTTESEHGLGVNIGNNPGLMGYFITKQGAEKFLQHQHLFMMEIDRTMCFWWLHQRNFHVLFYSVGLFWQDDVPSQMGYDAPHDFYEQTVLMKLLVFIHKLEISLKKRLLFPFYARKIRREFSNRRSEGDTP